ncbi:hypothetical protein [Streptomyces albipurpureus]|uniref:Uncharacterized protein n=1 Tax=Streptomyces albipurpureus TaxID=2897419 RepID=A0ABT0V481_9ACTN|nr:hypothetical protein [Streptomyces sp. CWNU-1]MCM2394358.1 hypothetical protein [Streptomyces sp. CWNU-1]
MARVYATSADYQAYTGETPPEGIDAVLGRASTFLDSRVFRLCGYDADPATGMPTNAVVVAAFTAAVCAQVQWWGETGDELGTAGRYGTVKIGSVALSGPGSSAGGSAASVGGREVADAALEALRSPDLTPDIFVLGLVVS